MNEFREQILEKEKEYKNLEKSIKVLEKTLTNIFTCEHNDQKIIPELELHHSKIQFKVDFSKYVYHLKGTTSFFFHILLKNNEVEVISNASFFNNSYYIHSLEDFLSFQSVCTVVSKMMADLDLDLIKKHLITYKNTLKSLPEIKSEISNLESESAKFESKSTLKQLFNILKPVESFCLDSFLCDKFGISYDKKPNRKEVKKLKERIINYILPDKDDFHSRLRRVEYYFCYFEIKNGNILFHNDILKIHLSNNDLYYTLGDYTRKSKKKINELLSSQFYYKDDLIVNCNQVNQNLEGEHKIEELKSILKTDFVSNNVATF